MPSSTNFWEWFDSLPIETKKMYWYHYDDMSGTYYSIMQMHKKKFIDKDLDNKKGE